MPMAPAKDKGKKKGCCCGGCLWFVIISIIIFSMGWLTCELEHNNWDWEATKQSATNKLNNHLLRLKEYIFDHKGKQDAEPKPAVPEIPGVNDNNWTSQGDESYKHALALIKESNAASGADKSRLLRVARKELDNALQMYQKAEQVDTGNQQLLQKIAQTGKLLEKIPAVE